MRILAGPWTYRETLRLLGGLALTAAGALLTWRFTNELWNPLFPKSPAIHVLERLIERLAPEPEKVPELQPYPVRVNSNLHAVDVVEDLENLDEEDPPDFSPQFLDLIRFVELAARFGLSRDDSGNAKGLVTHPRHHLPSGRRLTRPVYNELLTLATDRWQFIQQHGPGIAPTWRVPPEEALELLRAVLHSRQAGRQTRQAGNQG